jgi:hypothetical protein
MSKPESLHFTDLTVKTESVLNQRSEPKPMNRKWTRVHFPIPDSWEAAKEVTAWLNANCSDQFSTYTYQNPKGKSPDYLMVVRFKDKNDALFFKLRGGHQAWEKS